MSAPAARARAFLSLLPPSSRLLAVDVGALKCGFAISGAPQPPGAAAASAPEGLGFVRAPPRVTGAPARAAYFAAITAALASRHGAGGALLGWPLLPTGAPGPSCAAVAAVRDALASAAPRLPLLLWDERSSTVAGRAALRAARGGGPLPPEWRGGRVDEAAAVEILRSFLLAAAVGGGGV
jgi:RNase H-fold protein (predicted Holliday junction resolvase)